MNNRNNRSSRYLSSHRRTLYTFCTFIFYSFFFFSRGDPKTASFVFYRHRNSCMNIKMSARALMRESNGPLWRVTSLFAFCYISSQKGDEMS